MTSLIKSLANVSAFFTDARLQRMGLSALLWVLFTPNALAFSDTQTHWGKTCIDQLAQQKLVSGYPNNSFRPQATINRAEFAILMLNAFPNAEVKRQAVNFKDVPASHWAYAAIRKAYEREFFTGYPDGTFNPAQPIPRVQALAILANASNYAIPEQPATVLGQYFEDAAQIPAYAKNAIASAAIGRLVVSSPNPKQLKPNQGASRGEVAAFLCQARNLAKTVPVEYIATGRQTFAIPPEAGGIGDFHGGLALAVINGKYGYINSTGEIAIAPQFAEAMSFSDGLAAVKQNNLWGFIDTAGNFVVSPQYTQAASFSKGLAQVTKDGKIGFIDRTGKLAFEVSYPNAQSLFVDSFVEGLARVRIDGQKTGFIDRTGKMALAPQSYTALAFSDGLALIEQNGKFGYIDRTGKVAIEPQFVQAKSFVQEMAPVVVNGKWGYINKSGNVVIQPQFESAQTFSEDLAGVKLQGKWGFIDRTGKIAIAPQFQSPEHFLGDGVMPFTNDFAMVRLGEKTGFINKQGQFVIQPQYANAASFGSNGLVRVNVAGKWVTEVTYGGTNSPPYFSTNLEGGKWGYIRLSQ